MARPLPITGFLARAAVVSPMPLTPFHLGPAVLLGALSPRRLDLPTLLVASVVVDVRAALVLSGVLEGRVHGILTTFLGGCVLAVVLAGIVLAVPNRLDGALETVRLGQTGETRPVLAAALVGVFSHVLLDAVLYHDARPLFPLEYNPVLLGPDGNALVYGGCLVAGVLGLGLLAVRFQRGGATD